MQLPAAVRDGLSAFEPAGGGEFALGQREESGPIESFEVRRIRDDPPHPGGADPGRDPGGPGRHDRQPAGEGFRDDEREAVLPARMKAEIGRMVERKRVALSQQAEGSLAS